MGAESGTGNGGAGAGRRGPTRANNPAAVLGGFSGGRGSPTVEGALGIEGDGASSPASPRATPSTGGAGVTINIGQPPPPVIAELTPETPTDTGSTGQSGTGQPSGRRRQRSSTLLTLGLADTTRKTLLGQ